jgi:hypothetical protein
MAGASAPLRGQVGLDRVAAVAGAFARQDLVAAREQTHLSRAFRLRGLERMHEGVDAVVAGERGEAEIGDDEPLGRKRVEFVRGRAGNLRHHDVDAGRSVLTPGRPETRW